MPLLGIDWVMPAQGTAQNQWNRSARINNKPVAERRFNITTVLLDTFMVCTFGFKDLFKSSSASSKCERRGEATCKFVRKCQPINLAAEGAISFALVLTLRRLP
ncbi:hypothetical protein P348_04344 [Enterobacter sp. DC3]|nr:hypothetical protein P348_04344 [Enterobacter sp. DC3]EWG77926.1 hypothetical protein P349_00727 [Enterobacter sp. DC4]